MAEMMNNGGGSHISGEKASEGGRGDPEKASPAAVEKYLKGITFPAGKDDLIEHAQGNNAPDDVMSVLERIDESREYHTAADVAKAVGEAE